MAGKLLAGAYARIEARLMVLEKLVGELERKLDDLEALVRHVDELERKLAELTARHV
jgi:hypothetical protein